MSDGNKLIKDVTGEVVTSLGPLREEMINIMASFFAGGMSDDCDESDFYSIAREGIVGLDSLNDVELVAEFKAQMFMGWGKEGDIDLSNEEDWAEAEHCIIYKNAVGLLEVDKLLREENL